MRKSFLHGESAWQLSGSPPRVREGRETSQEAYNKQRITPACAGTTRQGHERKVWQWDHPRVCGKDSSETSDLRSHIGSPPLAREGLIFKGWLTEKTRITPRSRGKDSGKAFPKKRIVGSPPHVREGPMRQQRLTN
mgnify:CR=1 FL=1